MALKSRPHVLAVVVILAAASASAAQVYVNRPSAPPALLAELKGKDPAKRREAANRLGALRSPEAVRPLIGALLDKDAYVREAAAFALGQTTDQRAVNPLLTALHDKDEEVRASVLFALGMLGDQKTIPVVSNLLEDRSAVVRAAAVVALGLMQDGEGADEMIDMLNDTSFDVRYDSVWALSQVREPDALEHVRAALVSLEAVRVNEVLREAFRQNVQHAIENLTVSAGSSRPRRVAPALVPEPPRYSSTLKPPGVKESVRPAPTERALRARAAGAVRLKVLVGADGRAVRAYVTRRLGYGLDQRAVQAVLQYRFDPAMQSGLPQTTWIDMDVRF